MLPIILNSQPKIHHLPHHQIIPLLIALTLTKLVIKFILQKKILLLIPPMTIQ